jgi:hypothetical protein
VHQRGPQFLGNRVPRPDDDAERVQLARRFLEQLLDLGSVLHPGQRRAETRERIEIMFRSGWVLHSRRSRRLDSRNDRLLDWHDDKRFGLRRR